MDIDAEVGVALLIDDQADGGGQLVDGQHRPAGYRHAVDHHAFALRLHVVRPLVAGIEAQVVQLAFALALVGGKGHTEALTRLLQHLLGIRVSHPPANVSVCSMRVKPYFARLHTRVVYDRIRHYLWPSRGFIRFRGSHYVLGTS